MTASVTASAAALASAAWLCASTRAAATVLNSSGAAFSSSKCCSAWSEIIRFTIVVGFVSVAKSPTSAISATSSCHVTTRRPRHCMTKLRVRSQGAVAHWACIVTAVSWLSWSLSWLCSENSSHHLVARSHVTYSAVWRIFEYSDVDVKSLESFCSRAALCPSTLWWTRCPLLHEHLSFVLLSRCCVCGFRVGLLS